MIDWLIATNEKCRDIAQKSRDALSALEKKDADGAKRIQEYMKADYKALVDLWEEVGPNKNDAGRLGDMGRHINFGKENDFNDILNHDLPDVQRKVEKLAKARQTTTPAVGFEELLHPVIRDTCVPLYRGGHLRESVLNAVIAIYDMIRHRTQSTLDGNALTGQAFGLENGRLIFSEVDTETGQNDQKGFLQIFQGVYTGVRNVKSHSLTHDLDEMKAAQYLVMLSLLARRVDECKDR